jgi:hypothetical protein
MSSIGDRVLQSLEQLSPRLWHRDIADQVGMTPDALSRALGGKRHFSSIEIARLADLTGTDLHWLITGQLDPSRLIVAARHDFDPATGERSVPGRESDEQALADIALAYRQAFPEPTDSVDWPVSAQDVRAALGQGFVRPFAERLEQRLDIGVVRVAELSTAYSFTIGGRAVIAVPATGNWFRENWDIGHELGHLVRRDHAEEISVAAAADAEAAANAFAADLLLPAAELEEVGWDSLSNERLADLIWAWGVSTDALARRLNALLGYVPGLVFRWAAQPTQRLLRLHLPADSDLEHITARMESASQRRFPLGLTEAHLRRIASGDVGPATLAWMLGIDADALEVDAPQVPEVDTDDLTAALGL